MLTVLIADDEKPARDKLAHQLSHCEGFTLIAQATNGEQAIEKINSLKPELVLLDVEMPNLNGLDVLDVLTVPCSVIFTTAYNQYAVKAFERAAVDYLLKPFSLARLKMALARVKMASQPPRDTATFTKQAAQFKSW
ncbi:MAG: response regulator [Algicola sp.]|nr:response regulator [Algicola sp.]